MFIGARKRNKWGVVYNSITKQGTNLAAVRLMDAQTGRVLQTRITDENGRYFFHVKPGDYRIEAVKAGHVFPSLVAKDLTEDNEYLDVYHGTPVHVENETDLTLNIPLDPNHPKNSRKSSSQALYTKAKTSLVFSPLR